MDIQEYKAFMQTDFNINEIHAMQQHWNQKLYFVDLMQNPRRNQGLLLLTDQSAVFTMPDGHSILAEAGDVMLLPCGARYTVSFQVSPEKTACPFLINARIYRADGTEAMPDGQPMRLCRDDGTLLPLFAEAAALYKGAHPAQLKATVYRLFSLLFPMAEKDECCIGYINSHFTEKFSIPQLAKQCALSESVYRRRFRQLTGLSPVQYINQLKVEKARQLLQSGDISHQQISDFLHFHSVSYFYRVFKAVTGQTPGEYRRHE
ncbi:MAG: helix-turn-helix transcriptional regulator [Oscillospiraceae bacterium]|nr:helix-turn-helix transcriptional regulator [Oscillospiraceae bacterium]